MSASDYFNPIPLFILFREAIEASIVVSVLLTFVARSSVPGLKAQSECMCGRPNCDALMRYACLPIQIHHCYTIFFETVM